MIATETAYAALESRDARFDGVFYCGVVTTGIYCKPSCPAVMPRRENIRIFTTPAAAQVNGFRACKRCRPDAVPGSPEWNVRADLVGRAMRLIADGVVDRAGVAGLADRLGYSERQLHRQLVAEVGAGPQALARAQRAQTARILLETTDLKAGEIAFAAGFASIRQFNETIKRLYATTPTGLRRTPAEAPGTIVLRLAYRPPLDLDGMLGFLGEHALPGLEEYDHGTYRRGLTLPHGTGAVALSGTSGTHIRCELHLTDLRDLTTAVQRCRRLLDLDADIVNVNEVLAADPMLAPLVKACPGRRIPGTVDPLELAARALLPRAELIALIQDGLFPRAEALTGHPVLGPLADGSVDLNPGADWDDTYHRLLALPGMTESAAALIRMRALGDPDVLLAAATPGTARWRPWRSYASVHLQARP